MNHFHVERLAKVSNKMVSSNGHGIGLRTQVFDDIRPVSVNTRKPVTLLERSQSYLD